MKCDVVSSWAGLARRVGLVVGLAAGLAVLPAPTSAGAPAGTWNVVVSTAPHLPQDVWFAGRGDNADGWDSGGCICLGRLAEGLQAGQHATLQTDVVEGGLIGVDGSPGATRGS